jgi:hypothetical protein
MIKIVYDVSYPGLTAADETRLAELLRRELQHHIVTIACRMVQEPLPPATEGDFINSMKLEVKGCVYGVSGDAHV